MAVPAAPTDLVATPDKYTVSIAFTPGASDPAITNYGYKIDDGDATALDPVDASSPVVIEGLDSNTEYSIVLYAVNDDGSSDDSDPVVTTTLLAPPAAPTSLVATPGDNTASIAFTPDATADPAITTHEYRVDGKGGWAAVAASPLVLTGLANNRAYSVAIRSVNADGTSAAATVSVTPADPSAANDNGYDDAHWAANPGAAVPNLAFNDPDD